MYKFLGCLHSMEGSKWLSNLDVLLVGSCRLGTIVQVFVLRVESNNNHTVILSPYHFLHECVLT